MMTFRTKTARNQPALEGGRDSFKGSSHKMDAETELYI